MIAYVVVGAFAAVDGFAAGVAVGRKFKKAVAPAVAEVKAEVATVEAHNPEHIQAAVAQLSPEHLEAHLKSIAEAAKA